ncbi:MAG TPA: CHASE3 domain-containing protein [Candidatus Acidoferrales bacterium]|jgi:signal transduction histidine kinase|nr:CHASE3 domain-containing protein [Candidatus Acidoferrales bacterium]
MSSTQKAKIALALALALLCFSGLAAGMVISRLFRAQALVRHTYEVEVAIGDLESKLTEVGRNRAAYVDSATPESLKNFWDAVHLVGPALAGIRQLTGDNPAQQALCDRLESNIGQRVALSRQLVELKQRNQSTPQTESQNASEVAKTAFDTARITRQMKQIEQTLLEQRSRQSNRLFATILSVLAVSFILSGCMFWLHYYLLNREFHERREAENQLRQLSVQLMRVQDEEHKRFARELHDGVGQTLAAAKMIATSAAAGNSGVPLAAELAALLEDAISQTRTMSYLFHPPLLDEIGFPSAAKWLIDGYAQRTGVAVSTNIPQPEHRLPRSLELTLYRVLQEALNNIQRHSKSAKAEVSVQIDPASVTLRVKDYGHGIPHDRLAALQANGTRLGVGLLGMKERVREQRGELKIGSHPTGTEIVVKIPYEPRPDSAGSLPSD